MSPDRRHHGRVAAIILALALICGPAQSGKHERVDFRITVNVEFGQPEGPSGLRDDLRHELVHELLVAKCFREVVGQPPETAGPDDLLLHLTLDDYEERVELDFALSQTTSPDLERDKLSTAYVEALLTAEVRTIADDLSVRTKRFLQRSSWRPRLHEDPRDAARLEFIESVVRAMRKLVCKGDTEKWAKQVNLAREAAK